MNVKHLSKFSISKRLIFLGAVITIAAISIFFICWATEADAKESATTYNDEKPEWNISCNNCEIWEPNPPTGDVLDSTWPLGTYNIFTDFDNISEHCYSEFIKMKRKSGECRIWQKSDTREGIIIKNLYIAYMDRPEDSTPYCYYTEVNCDPNSWWTIDGQIVPYEEGEYISYIATYPSKLNIKSPIISGSRFNASGFVNEASNSTSPVAGAFVQYCQWNPWFWDYVPVPEMNTFTDWFGNYTIEGVSEDMLPGVIRVYRFGYEVAESAPIWFVPEGIDTIYRFIEMAPSEPPVPPTPPTPPDPPVPPVPPQPDPPQPVPPTPVDPGGGIAQTSDAAPFAAIAVFAVVAALGFGVALRKEYF